MGASQSTIDAVKEQLPEVASAGATVEAPVLLKLNVASEHKAWVTASQNAVWRFYNANEETNRQTCWYLEVESGDVDMLIAEAAEMQIDTANKSATFFDAESMCVCKLIFPSDALCHSFCDDYHNKLYENISTAGQVDLGSASDWFFQPADVEPMEWENIEEPEGPQTPRLTRQKEALNDRGSVVTGVAMGAGENSFLLQEGRVSVLRNDYGAVQDSGRGFTLTPPRSTNLGGATTPFQASKVMLAQGETQMNMLTPTHREAVVQADLERGEVVRQWNCVLNGVEVPMSDIAADTRSAQLDHRSTFLGLDANRICRWDQRTAEGVVADLTYKAGKDYSGRPHFTCMATSGEGFVAVGSRDGQIRLYGSKKAMEDYGFGRAMTSVPGLGLPITAIDVSFDGRYIVGTTDKYLVVVSATFRDAKGAEANGFTSRMGAKAPAPRLLKLSPEDRLRAGRDAVFSKGRLTWVTEAGVTERWIAASCGQYSVLWNFRQIKAQKPSVISNGAFTICSHYSMLRKDERVVDNAFLHDKFAVTPQAKNALVVATQHQLFNCVDEDSDFE